MDTLHHLLWLDLNYIIILFTLVDFAHMAYSDLGPIHLFSVRAVGAYKFVAVVAVWIQLPSFNW